MHHADARFAHCNRLYKRAGELSALAVTLATRSAASSHATASVLRRRRPVSVDAARGTRSRHAASWSTRTDDPPTGSGTPFRITRKGRDMTSGRRQPLAPAHT